jgi:predicted Fe-S protein YdhL (DUF1289 family)
MDEIVAWRSLSARAKRAVLAKLESRTVFSLDADLHRG